MNSETHFKRFVVYRRLAELFLPCIVLSLIITVLNVTGLVVKRNSVIIMISMCMALFVFFNFTNLRNCYFDMCNKKLYFMLNFFAQAVFTAVNMIFYAFASTEIYTWIFSITKVLTFVDMDTLYSVLCFHCIGIVSVLAAPIGMGWIFEDDEDMPENMQ